MFLQFLVDMNHSKQTNFDSVIKLLSPTAQFIEVSDSFDAVKYLLEKRQHGLDLKIQIILQRVVL